MMMTEERAIEMRLPRAIVGFSKWTSEMPFAKNFEQIVRSMGITQLREVA